MNVFVELDDPSVVEAARRGDRNALADIIERHRPWVYNIALRMLRDPGDAEDATQDIFIKVIRRLDSFEGRGAFRSWLYRVAFNHLLNVKRGRAAEPVGGFDDFAEGLRNVPDLDLTEIPAAERVVLVEEAKIGCMTGMLMCLSREQRLAYVLGALFELPDTLGAEILEIQPATFRKRLQRARTDIHAFMDGHCGLLNQANPCRCARKTRAFMDAGYLDRNNLTFQRDRIASVGEVASRNAGKVFKKVTRDYPALYREHPFADPQELKARLSTLLEDTALDDLIPKKVAD